MLHIASSLVKVTAGICTSSFIAHRSSKDRHVPQGEKHRGYIPPTNDYDYHLQLRLMSPNLQTVPLSDSGEESLVCLRQRCLLESVDGDGEEGDDAIYGDIYH